MSLRTRVLRGGYYLILRQGLGIGVSALGIILLTRAIGPDAYGLYAGAVGIFAYLSALSTWGVDVYLIRHAREPSPDDYHQAFSLLLLASLGGTGLAFLALPFLDRWMNLEGFVPIAIALFATLPISLLSIVPFARLERAIDYRSVALVELSAQLIFYPVAVPLAYQGLGPWAPVLGWYAQQLCALGLVYKMSGYRPRLRWEFARVRDMVGYGFGMSASDWLWKLANLVNPLVVGRYVGAEAVGQVALAQRFIEQLGSIIVLTAGRLSVPVFARLQEDRARLLKALTQGMSLQLIILGPTLAGFGLVLPWALPLLFGPSWLPVLDIYPFLALSYLTGTAFGLHSSALFVLRRIWEVAAFRLVDLVLFAGSALLLAPHLGLMGYAWAEVIHIPSWILLLTWFHRRIGWPNYTQAGVWFVAWAIPLFVWQLGLWTWIIVVVPLLWPSTRRELVQTAAMVLRRSRSS